MFNFLRFEKLTNTTHGVICLLLMVSNETVLHFDRKYAPQNIAMNVLTTNEFHLLGFFLLVLSTVVKIMVLQGFPRVERTRRNEEAKVCGYF